MLIKNVVEKTTQFLKEKKINSARLESEILISSALGVRRIDLYLKYEQPLNETEIQNCREAVRRRGQGEPVAYIIGSKEFFGLDFKVDGRVLIPRPETEFLVEKALAWMKTQPQTEFKTLDLGSGSGCVGISLSEKSTEEKKIEVTLVEASPEAFEVLSFNHEKFADSCSQRHLLNSRVQDCDFDAQKFDIILANPPYIAKEDAAVDKDVRQFEPHTALFAEENGFQEIEQWLKKSLVWLKSPGMIIFEIGMGQKQQVLDFFQGKEENVSVQKDFSGLDRYIVVERG